MSNKTQLQTNNTAFDALITRVNAAKDTAASLPDAGGSGNYPDEDLDSVITELETKVSTLNTTLDGKASGGSIETCTLQVTNNLATNSTYYCCSIVANGVLSGYDSGYFQGTDIINNLACGSIIYVKDAAANGNFTASANLTLVGRDMGAGAYRVDAINGDTCTITISSSSGGGY